MTKAQEILAKINEEASARAAQLNDEALIAAVTHPAYVGALAASKAAEGKLEKLNNYLKQCEAIVEAMPIYSENRRQTVKFRPSSQFGLSTEISKLIAICTGIQYAKAEHKVQMLAITGLSETLVEQTLADLGSLPYYNSNYGVLVDGTMPNVEALKQDLILVATTLGVTVDTSFMTQAYMERRYEAAMIREQKKEAEAVKAALTEANKIII